MSGVPRRVLITGCPGFLGSAIEMNLLCAYEKDTDGYISVDTLSRSYSHCFSHYEVDLTNEGQVKQAIDEIRPNVVFHCASVALSKTDEKDPNGIIQANICGTHNLLRALSKLSTKPRVVFSSSVTVFGNFDPDRPANFFTRENPKSLYSITKLACEHLINIFSEQNYIDGISVRLPALVGINSTHGLVHDLLRKVNSDDEVLNLIGEAPGSKKPFVHVDEVAELLVKIGLSKPGYDYKKQKMLLVGNIDSLTVEQVANIIMQEMKKSKKIKWSGESWAGDNNLINLDPDITMPSNSYESIVKVVEEWRKNNV